MFQYIEIVSKKIMESLFSLHIEKPNKLDLIVLTIYTIIILAMKMFTNYSLFSWWVILFLIIMTIIVAIMICMNK